MTETETIDRLFLELSQFTRATTAKELALVKAIKPFADVMHASSGRIPVEKLSLRDWHELVKAYDAATKEPRHDN